MTAMEQLRGFPPNTPWVDRISRLLVTTLPNNTDGTLRERDEELEQIIIGDETLFVS
jgi:hypothetical protein